MPNWDVDEDQRVGYDRTSPRAQEDLIREKLDIMNPQDNERLKFLQAIKEIESSGGKNTAHPVIQVGPQAGERALGEYGLLPNTIRELTNRAKMEGTATPEMLHAARQPASIAHSPALERQFAEQLAGKVLGTMNDPAMAAYAWNAGHNLTPERVQSRRYLENPYVKKFQKIWKMLGGK